MARDETSSSYYITGTGKLTSADKSGTIRNCPKFFLRIFEKMDDFLKTIEKMDDFPIKIEKMGFC